MEKILLVVSGVANHSNPESPAYTLILSEKEGVRKLPVIIGFSEAQAIAIQLEGLVPMRPLVYDLFFSIASAFSVDVVEIVISNVDRGIFFAEIVCCNIGSSEDDYIRIPARTSDAVAIALKFSCPIYTYEHVLDRAGFEWTATDVNSFDSPNIEGLPVRELKDMLRKAIAREDYEFASKIRDELAGRK